MSYKFKKGDKVIVMYYDVEKIIDRTTAPWSGTVTSLENPGLKGYIMVLPDRIYKNLDGGPLPCFEEELTPIPLTVTKVQLKALKLILGSVQ